MDASMAQRYAPPAVAVWLKRAMEGVEAKAAGCPSGVTNEKGATICIVTP